MNRVTAVFLTARHWQVFLLLLIAPYAATAAYIVFPGAIYLAMAVMLLWGLCMLGWYWCLGSFLASLVDAKSRMNRSFFHFAFVYPLLYSTAFIWLFLSQRRVWPEVIIPLHLFAMFCIFYAIYFVAKNLAMAETGKLASFADYAAPFVLLWFFPIGVWVIQPKVNRLYLAAVGLKDQTGMPR